ncbi:hypothetical protein ELE36_14375 [Pseudolysobacter antarcticus]|uniref:Uncharacterized protein n=1 Tax=Pseudolysobacter antarcticus TaxID=2511995 RepID=A0A411HM53_9GAMM|nr:hypothetical protein [Pseudolysobacter antarcticus]QBB71447.1 hypothetical protein ELE36_14375 [Pseudolysobacter antarcticus]
MIRMGQLLLLAAFWLVLFHVAPCLADPVPEMVPFHLPPPANTPFNVDAYFPGTDLGMFQVDVADNIITAHYQNLCSSGCKSPYYGVHTLDLPALAAGSYILRVVPADMPTQLIAQFPLDVGGAIPTPPAPQLVTVPAIPQANQSFVAYGFLVVPGGVVQSGRVGYGTVSGNIITANLQFGCPFECPPWTPGLTYGPFQFSMPALAAGTYTINFVDRRSGGQVVVAQLPLVIAAAPIPALHGAWLYSLIALLAIAGCVATMRRDAVTKHSRNLSS